jgi:peptide/nickel transport system ATP-binding protein
MAVEETPLLEVDHLVMRYGTKQGEVSAIEDVSFVMHRGDSLGLVGESGCGKTSVAMALLRLQPDNAHVKQGSIRLGGLDLLTLSEREMRKHRWNDIAMVFQGAMNAWNPVYTVARQIEEAMRAHTKTGLTRSEARKRIAELFDLVGLSPEMMDRYPHEYSGGMRQRAVIAMALSCDPQLIIADEPTTALDVIVQDRILRRLKQIRAEFDMSIIYISHDIAVIAEVADRIGVMYAGKLVEIGTTDQVFTRPRHPYSWALLTSTPSIHGPRRVLVPLQGEPPNLLDPPSGCRFHPRCPLATEKCESEEPPLAAVDGGQQVACWHWDKVPAPGDQEMAS